MSSSNKTLTTSPTPLQTKTLINERNKGNAIRKSTQQIMSDFENCGLNRNVRDSACRNIAKALEKVNPHDFTSAHNLIQIQNETL